MHHLNLWILYSVINIQAWNSALDTGTAYSAVSELWKKALLHHIQSRLTLVNH